MIFNCVAARLGALALCAVAMASSARQASAQVLLRQVYGGGGGAGALYTNDFVELHNYGAAQSLAGWSVQVASATGSTWSVASLPNVTLDPGKSFLVRLGAGGTLPAGQSLALPSSDATSLVTLGANDGKVALVASTVALSGTAPSAPSIVDLVGYGPLASWNESGAPFDPARNATAPSNELALVRWNCAAPDSDDNALDWAACVPAPRNSAMAPIVGLSAAGLCSPHLVEPGRSVRLSVEAVDCSGARVSPAASVTANLSALGGPALVALSDDGLAGDLQASDGVWSTLITVGAGVAIGPAQIPVSVVDGAGSTELAVAIEVRSAASPDNDSCRDAFDVGPLPASVNAAFASGGAEYNPVFSASSISPPGSMGSRRGQWYSVLGTGATMSAASCASPLLNTGAIPDTVLMVLCGSCDALSVVTYNDDAPALCGVGSGIERRSSVSWCSTAGVTYWIWIAPFNGGANSFAYALDVWDDGVPCVGALECATCAPPTVGELELEAVFGPALNDGCDTNRGGFVEAAPGFPAQRWLGSARQWGASRDCDWYRFHSPSSANLTATLTSQFHGVVELWQLAASGECSGAMLLAASSASVRCGVSTASIPTLAGEWYAVRVVPQNTFGGAAWGGFAPGGDGAAYALDLELSTAIAGDLCSTALGLVCPTSTLGATLGATPDIGLASCVGPGAQDLAVAAPGVWYELTLPGVAGVDDRVIDAQLSAADYDARLSIFEGSCGALTCVTASDAAAPAGLPRSVWRATAGATYRILVHGAAGQTGAFALDVSCALPIDGDECSTAIVLSGESGTVAGDLIGSTGAASTGYSSSASCAPAWTFFDVWYELSVACATQVSLDTCGATDTVLSLHSACPDPWQTFELPGACSDDGAGACAPGSQLSVALPAGTYLVRVAAREPIGAFTLSWSLADSDGDGVWDCSDGCPLDPLKLAPGQCGCGFVDDDGDGDGAADCIDECPLDPLKLAPGQCGCGFADDDSDGDGVADCNDLCPLDPFKDAPGVCGCGVADDDSDSDGVADCDDLCPLDPLKLFPGICGCGVTDDDTDGDGVLDCNDGCPLDPLKLSPGSCGCGVADDDSDGDGVADCNDLCPLDPLKLAPGQCGCGFVDDDGDGDGAADCIDECPLDPLKLAPGQCGCGFADDDSDGDGVADCNDLCPLDPFKDAPGVCGCGVADDDSDSDGVADCDDLCPLDPLKLFPGICGCGVTDDDTDGDGVLDCNDGCPLDPLKLSPGSCGCGFADDDSDGDGVADCHDGCPFDPLKLAPGQCGCGLVEDDTDGDSVADCIDNCVALANPLQDDCDLDGIGDVCEFAAGTARDMNGNDAPDNCELGAYFNYCTAGTSTHGCLATMSASGTFSASASSGFVVSVNGVEGDKQGIMFYGITGPTAQPWFGGSSSFKCVKAPFQRMGAQNSFGTAGECDGVLSEDVLAYFTTFPSALGAPLFAGELFNFQAWYRDPPAPSTTSLSDALQATCAP